jgi:uncharacterized protein YbbK (DUF523 family)
MTPSHLPTADEIQKWRLFTEADPIRILVSGCLAGIKCGYDGTSYGEYPLIIKLMTLPNVYSVTFCPEEFSFGTPRDLPDIHGGTGEDVIEGRAKVITDKGADWTEGMLAGARQMLDIALREKVDLAILTDMSAACGTQVISRGNRLVTDRAYLQGHGVCAALLIQNGFKAVSQRDYKTLNLLFRKLGSITHDEETGLDHHETHWYQSYFR